MAMLASNTFLSDIMQVVKPDYQPYESAASEVSTLPRYARG